MQTTIIARLLCFMAALSSSSAYYVFNGDDAPPALYRFFVDMYGCSGALISSKFVITAAHCVLRKTQIEMEVTTRVVDRVSWKTSEYDRRYPLLSSKFIINHLYIKEKEKNPGKVTSTSIINDIAVMELEKPVSVCDDVVGPLAILLPLDSEETPDNMVKRDKYHQCIQAGFGSQIDEDAPEDYTKPRHMKQQRIREHRVWEFDGKSGKLLDFWSDNNAHICGGDSGSAIFCIINDRPTMVSLSSTSAHCGSPNTTSFSGPTIRELLPIIKDKMTIEQWNGLMAEQTKCRGYYEKNGFLTEYVKRVKAKKYPPVDSFPDTFVYPSVDSISMDGSYPVPVTQPPPVPTTPVPIPVPVRPENGSATDQTDIGPLPPARLTSTSLKVHVSIFTLVVAIVLAH